MPQQLSSTKTARQLGAAPEPLDDIARRAPSSRLNRKEVVDGVVAAFTKLRAAGRNPREAHLRGRRSVAAARLVGRARGHEELRADRRRSRRARSARAEDDVGALGALQHPAGGERAARGRDGGDAAGGNAARAVNDFKRAGYGGPCPPIGRHRYFHKLYALDVVLADLRKPTKAALEKAMAGHVLAEAQLVGTYEKKKVRRQRCDQHTRACAVCRARSCLRRWHPTRPAIMAGLAWFHVSLLESDGWLWPSSRRARSRRSRAAIRRGSGSSDRNGGHHRRRGATGAAGDGGPGSAGVSGGARHHGQRRHHRRRR